MKQVTLSPTILSVLSSPGFRQAQATARAHNKRIIRSGVYGHLDALAKAQRQETRYLSGLIDTARFAHTIDTRPFANLVDSRALGQRFLQDIELDPFKRVATMVREELARPYARHVERMREQLLRHHSVTLQHIIRDAIRIEPRTFATMQVALARAAVPAEVPQDGPAVESPELDASDIAMLALLVEVIHLVLDMAEDARDVLLLLLATYVLLAHPTTRAGLARALRGLQGRD
jgi:hypothetical protein